MRLKHWLRWISRSDVACEEGASMTGFTRAAQKAAVGELLTDNLKDFAGLEDGFSSVAP
jgi:hypothetical protein